MTTFFIPQHAALGAGDYARQNLLMQEQISNARLQNKLLAARAAAAQDTAVPMAEASLESQRTKNRLSPLMAALSAQNALTQQGKVGQSQTRFGGAYQLSKSLLGMTSPARQTWINENLGGYSAMLTDLANKVLHPDTQAAVPNILTASLFEQAGIPVGDAFGSPPPGAPALTPQAPHAPAFPSFAEASPRDSLGAEPPPLANLLPQIAPLAQSPLAPSTPKETPPPEGATERVFAPMTPAQLNVLKDVGEQAIIKATVPTPVQAQRYYAASAGRTFNNMSQFLRHVQGYARYSGSLTKLLHEQSVALGGKPSADYQGLVFFTQQMPILANEIRRMFGGQATDAEARVMDKVTLGNIQKMSPDQVIKTWNQLGGLLNQQSLALKMTPTQVQSSLGSEFKRVQGWSGDTFTDAEGKTYTHAQIEALAGEN